MERDGWMSEQVAGEIEDLRRRFGFERKEAVAYWHLLHARQLMSEMGQTDHFEELEREGRSELEADFHEFAGLIHDISVLELAPIGGQLFAHENSQRDCTAFRLLIVTFTTRLLAQPLRRD